MYLMDITRHCKWYLAIWKLKNARDMWFLPYIQCDTFNSDFNDNVLQYPLSAIMKVFDKAEQGQSDLGLV